MAQPAAWGPTPQTSGLHQSVDALGRDLLTQPGKLLTHAPGAQPVTMALHDGGDLVGQGLVAALLPCGLFSEPFVLALMTHIQHLAHEGHRVLRRFFGAFGSDDRVLHFG
ncbi:hypothetical protein JOF55_004787 [Haloactinomyces albus]|uniref:Uncharacterized protein n=1 Tax=Haloactinomyces albus TaxID=1352928 RepID=A0AAE4CSC3_9ACTN|nr:hypothetical protein [Haloactinomyces albus]MDR7304543.1 hypothetical protein [Haloactinomyces albus]